MSRQLLPAQLICAGIIGFVPTAWAQLAGSTDAESQAADAPAATASEQTEPLPTIPLAEPPPPPMSQEAHAGSSNALLEEVVVTAQKREERLQDVPIAIQAFSADKLAALGVQSVQDMQRVTPGLTVTNAVGFNVVYLRGVGTDAFLPGADSSVPFYLDGVPLLAAQGSTDTLGRIARVEVLKGPQGTLFGRNATGGAINVITPDPDAFGFSGDLSAEYGNYDAKKLTAYLNVPLADGLAASVSGFVTDQENFYVNDAGPIADIYSRGGRLKLLWVPADDFSVSFSGSYQKSSGNGGLTFENTRVASLFRAILPQDPRADRHVSFDSLAGTKAESYLFSGDAKWNFQYFDTRLIASTQKLRVPFVNADFDKSALPIVNITSIRQNSTQDTIELQFLSNDETIFADHLKWVGGFFYLKSSGGFDPIAFTVAPGILSTLLGVPQSTVDGLDGVLTGLGLPSLASGLSIYNYGVLESVSYSGYLQGTYSFNDEFNLTLGGRFQKEYRDLVNSHTSIPRGNDGQELTLLRSDVPTLHATQISPRVALQWKPAQDTQVYLSWSRAYKSPTYNTVNLLAGLPTTISSVRDVGELLQNLLQGESLGLKPEIKPVKEERDDAYELGLKTQMFDSNLRLNAAAFYTEQRNLLSGFVSLLSGGVVSYDNVPAARIYGVEADALLRPLPELDPGLVFTAAATVLNAKYTDYPEGKGYDEASGISFGNAGTQLLPARDFGGNDIVRTPKLTWNLGISQTISMGDGSLEISGDVNYSGKMYFNPQNSDLYMRRANTLVNLRTAYTYEPLDLQIGIFINNLTNQTYNEIVFVDDFGRNQVLNDPRTYGLRAKWTFGN